MNRKNLALLLSVILLLCAVPTSAFGSKADEDTKTSPVPQTINTEQANTNVSVTPALSVTPKLTVTPAVSLTPAASIAPTPNSESPENGVNAESGSDNTDSPQPSIEPEAVQGTSAADADSILKQENTSESEEPSDTEILPEEESVSAEVSPTQSLKEEESAKKDYSLSLSDYVILFDSQTEGYTETQTIIVTVTNTGSEPWDFSGTKYDQDIITIENFPSAPLASGESIALSITTKTGLHPAYYEDDNYFNIIYFYNENSTSHGIPSIECHYTVRPGSSEDLGNLISIPTLSPVVDIPNGTGKKAWLLGLPDVVSVLTSLGEYKAEIHWNLESCTYDPDSKERQEFLVQGQVELPEGLNNPDNIATSVEIQVTVNAFDAANQTEYLLASDVSSVDFNYYYEHCDDDVEGPMINLYNKGTKPLSLTVLMPAGFSWNDQSAGEDIHNLLPGESFLLELREDYSVLGNGKNTGNMKVVTQIPGVELNILLIYEKKVEEAEITASRGFLDFGCVNQESLGPDPQTVTVKNTGSKTVTVKASDRNKFFTVNPSSGIVLKPGESRQFTILPRKNLKEGYHTGEIHFSAGTTGETVRAAVEIRSNSTVLTRVREPGPVTVENGRQKLPHALGLPGMAVLETEDEDTYGMINWDVGQCAYNPNEKKEQKFQVTGKVVLPFNVINPDNLDLTITADVTVKAAAGHEEKKFSLSLSQDVVYITRLDAYPPDNITITNTGTRTIQIEDTSMSSNLYFFPTKKQLKPKESTTLNITVQNMKPDFQQEEIELYNYDGTLLNTLVVIWRQKPSAAGYRFSPSNIDFGRVIESEEMGALSPVTFENNSGQDIVISGAESEYFTVQMEQDILTVKDGEKAEFVVRIKPDGKNLYPPKGTYEETIRFRTSYYMPVLLDASMEIRDIEETVSPTPVPTRTPTKAPTVTPTRPAQTLTPTPAVKSATVTPVAPKSQEKQKEAVQTGDETPVGIWIAMLMFSAAAAIVLLSLRRSVKRD